MSVRDVLNAIKLLFGMSSVDLSRVKWFVLRLWQIFFLFWADLAKFTKNARNTVECYLKAKH